MFKASVEGGKLVRAEPYVCIHGLVMISANRLVFLNTWWLFFLVLLHESNQENGYIFHLPFHVNSKLKSRIWYSIEPVWCQWLVKMLRRMWNKFQLRTFFFNVTRVRILENKIFLVPYSTFIHKALFLLKKFCLLKSQNVAISSNFSFPMGVRDVHCMYTHISITKLFNNILQVVLFLMIYFL